MAATPYDRPRLGAFPGAKGTRFTVWAPAAERVTLVTAPDGAATTHTLQRLKHGYFTTAVADAPAGTRYGYRLNDGPLFPDPASRFQPEGVHGPSEVIDPTAYAWTDEAWAGIPHDAVVLYELHVGTFTDAGTFDGVQARLDHLASLGITAIELLPVADFPGRWNWGYDHAALFAPSRAYGRPDDLRRLVDAAHHAGLAVYLDVIYNHLGPDGAYAAAFQPMFTAKHTTPWGAAINLDDTYAAGVRDFFLQNARYWLEDYHIDGFRLDAIQTIYDDSEPHFLAELGQLAKSVDGPERLVIAEDDRNLNTVVLPQAQGGYGLDAMWIEDFNHLIRTHTVGTDKGIFAPFAALDTTALAETIERGWFYDGKATPSGTQRGSPAHGIAPRQCVFYIQNHDQVGNRPHGERLHHETSWAAYRAATALLLFLPQTPLLFMGQEWAASTPFQFFTDHHETLGRQVTEGRRREQVHVAGFDGPGPDPQAEETFQRSVLAWEECTTAPHRAMLTLYRTLLDLRKTLQGPASAKALSPETLRVKRGTHRLIVAFSGDQTVPCLRSGTLQLHTEEARFAPDGQAPVLQDQHVYFPTAGALLWTDDAQGPAA